jgi:GNAT superfamily N-acetyltransferase
MGRVSVTVESPVSDTFRVAQVAGIFDLKSPGGFNLGGKLRHEFDVEVPDLSEPWGIGVIVGPSGSGKSTVARAAYGEALYRPGEGWPAREACLEGFGQALSIDQITGMLTGVGFGSAPDWCKPYEVLSNGQKMRADLARALLSGRDVVAFDEYTSVVDRQVAKVGSAAVAKAIRSGRVSTRLVAVTCHYDVIDWLEPDWILDMATGELTRGLVRRRPPLDLQFVPVSCAAWSRFGRHHYLDSKLHKSSQCYGAVLDGELVAMCAMLYVFGYKNYWRVSRIVTLPDYQGVGIATALMDWCCDRYHRQGKRVSIVAAHPAMRRALSRSRKWKLSAVLKKGYKRQEKAHRQGQGRVVSAGRAVKSYVYVGSAAA